jgi:hypothetical protein
MVFRCLFFQNYVYVHDFQNFLLIFITYCLELYAFVYVHVILVSFQYLNKTPIMKTRIFVLLPATGVRNSHVNIDAVGKKSQPPDVKPMQRHQIPR